MAKRYPQTMLATACVPWTESYQFDEDAFRSHVRVLIGSGLKHIYLFGTAGEGYAVTDEQFRTVVQAFADEMNAPGLRPMVGLIGLSLPIMLQRLQTAYDSGIREFQFALPCWGALSDGELGTFFHGLCDPFPDCGFLHYNLARTGRLLGIGEYKRLADELPNLVGVKFSTGDIPTILDLADGDCPLQFFLTEMGFACGSMLGEFGFLVSIASSSLVKAREFYNACVAGNKDRALAMQKELRQMLKELLAIAGSGKIDGAYDKIYCKLNFDGFPLRLLPPYAGVSEGQYCQYRGFLKERFPHWLASTGV